MVNASAYGIVWPKAVLPSPLEGEGLGVRGLQTQSAAKTPFLLSALAWGRASGALGERTEREFVKESAALANSLLLAHSKDSGKPENKSQALLAVQVLGSIALEAVALGSLPSAVEKLKAMELRELFRLGWSLTREVARDAWVLAMDDRISRSGLERNLKWLPDSIRESVLEAEDMMSWIKIASTASGEPDAKLLTWPRLCRLRIAVDTAQAKLLAL